MLPKVARLKSSSSNRIRWSLLLCGLALLAVPTWYVRAQPPAAADPAKAQPEAKIDTKAETKAEAKPETKTDDKAAPSKGTVKPEIKKPVAHISSAGVRRPALPAMAPPSVEYLPEPIGMEKQILEILDEQADFEFTDESLEGILAFLTEKHGLQFVTDRGKLEDESVPTDANMFTLKLSGISLRSGLKILLTQKNLAYIIDDEVIKVTTFSDAIQHRPTRTYPVRDLVGNVDVDYQLLSEAIQQSTGGQPDEPWSEADGEGGSISILPATGCLVIRQTEHAHEEILKLLRALRKANAEMQPKTSHVAPATPTSVAGIHVDCKLLNYRVADARYYPLVGPARLATAHFQCTVRSDRAVDVAYVDASHLIQTR